MIELDEEIVMQLFVAGEPYAQTRARHGPHGEVYSDASEGLKRWKALVGQAMLKAQRELALGALAGVLRVDMVFMLPTKDKSRWGQLCPMKPDKDNLEKAVLDVMGDCRMFAKGDQQVAAGGVTKLWCSGGQEGVTVRVARAKVKKEPVTTGDDDGHGVEDWLAS